MKKVLSLSLLLLLLLTACDNGVGTQPGVATLEGTATSAVETEPIVTPEAVETTAITETEDITTGTDITGSEEITDATAMTETLDMTGTQGMTETGMEEAPRELILASDLQGYNVQNPNGESLGSVQDLVFNLDDGQIVLVTVEYGGFLDIGDKVFPIPLSAFRFEQMTADISGVAPMVPGGMVTDTTGMTDTTGLTDTTGATGVTDTTGAGIAEPMVVATSLILDIPEETFENAPGFEDNFPVLTDPATVGELETFYRDLGEDVVGQPIAETDLDALAGRAVKLSDITDRGVQNPAGEGIGEIEDMLLDLQAGRVEYLILSFGGFLGIGENQHAIPVDAFEVIPSSADVEAGEPELVLDVTEEQLEGAPVFDELNLGNLDWDIDVQSFWLNR